LENSHSNLWTFLGTKVAANKANNSKEKNILANRSKVILGQMGWVLPV